MPPSQRLDPLARLLTLAASQDDVILTRDARRLGVTDWELRCLQRASELIVPRGALAVTPVRNPVRTLARATQLLLPDSAISHVTAVRLHSLEGLPYWEPGEPVDVTLSRDRKRAQRAGMRMHFSALCPDDVVDLDGLRVASAPRALIGCADLLDRNRFVCLTDCALRLKSLDAQELATMREVLIGRGLWRAAQWLDLADGRSESPSETSVRLVLHDGGVPPDHLQYEVFTPGGFLVARLDMAWVRDGKKVGMEVESRFHDRMPALYRDREKLNALRALDWDVRQVTAYDARRRPGYILQQAHQALEG